MRHRSALLAAGLCAFGARLPAQEAAPAPRPAAGQETVAIINAKIYTVSGPVIENGTVLIRNGRIVAVGANVDLPQDARFVNAAGMVVTPGLLDSSTQLGVTEIGAVATTSDASTRDDRVTAAFNVVDGLNPRTTLIPINRVEGVTRAVVAPESGISLISGQGVLIDLGSDVVTEMVHRNPVAMFAVLVEEAIERAGGSRGAAMMRLREALQDARDFGANRRAFETGQRREYHLSRLDLEALQPVLRGEVPLAVRVNKAADILSTLRLGREYGLRIILLGAGEGWTIAREIAAARVPVVLNPFTNIPTYENIAATLENAARLDSAGVPVAFATFEAHNARNLKQAAGIAVAYGMPWEAALRAVTLTPARIWGIADRYGTIEPGKDADLVVWSGDPFELSTRVQHVFIRGREVPKDHRQRLLFERYRTLEGLPPAYRRPE